MVTKEIERKWLVDPKHPLIEAILSGTHDEEYLYAEMSQFYVFDPSSSIDYRYRISVFPQGEPTAERTYKTGKGMVREEHNEYRHPQFVMWIWDCLEEEGYVDILKCRYRIPHGDVTIELDELTRSTELQREEGRWLMAEIEFPSEEAANAFTDIPEYFVKEVTGREDCTMSWIFDELQGESEEDVQ